MSATAKLHTTAAMIKATVTSATSEADGHPKEFLIDNNPDTYWKPTSTGNNDIVIDLGIGGTLITAAGDRDFSSTSNWSNNDLSIYNTAGNNLLLGASAIGEYCSLAAAGFDSGHIQRGKTYILQFDYASGSGDVFKFCEDDVLIGNVEGTGTAQQIEFTATIDGPDLRIYSLTDSAGGTFDNIQIMEKFDDAIVTGWNLLLSNYNTDHGPTSSPRLNVQYSDDGITFTNWDTGTFDGTWQTTVGRKILLGSEMAEQQHRYYKFLLSSMATTIQISGLFLCRLETISYGNQYPERDDIEYKSVIQKVSGGVFRARRQNINEIWTRPRVWFPPFSADKDALENVIKRSRGSSLPIIVREDTEEAEMMFIYDKLPRVYVSGYESYSIPLVLRTLPQIDPAEGY